MLKQKVGQGDERRKLPHMRVTKEENDIKTMIQNIVETI